MILKDKTIVSFWHNKDDSKILPNIVLMSIQSFLQAGFKYILHSYQQFDNVPAGCILEDANSIMDYSEFFVHKSGSVAPFSDYFRIKLLLKDSNFAWSDTDNIFLKDCYSNSILAIIQDGRIQNSIFCFPDNEAGQKIRCCLKQFIGNPTKIQQYDSKKLRKLKLYAALHKTRTIGTQTNFRSLCDWTFAGSELYTSIFKHLKLEHLAYDYYKYFNPYKYTVQNELYDRDESLVDKSKFKDVGVLVLSSDLLRREPQIAESFNENSFIGKLLNKFGVERKIS